MSFFPGQGYGGGQPHGSYPPQNNYGPPPPQNYGQPPQQNYGPPPQQYPYFDVALPLCISLIILTDLKEATTVTHPKHHLHSPDTATTNLLLPQDRTVEVTVR